MLVGSEAGLYSVKRSAEVDLSCSSLAEKWKEMRKGDLRWLTCTYTNKKTVSFHRCDDAPDLTSLKKLLEQSRDHVVYGVFSVKINGIIRWIFFSFIGESVSGMSRAKVSMHKSAVSNYFEGIVASILLSSHDDLSDENLLSCLSSSEFQKSSIHIVFSEDGVGVHSSQGSSEEVEHSDEILLLGSWNGFDPIAEAPCAPVLDYRSFKHGMLWSNIANKVFNLMSKSLEDSAEHDYVFVNSENFPFPRCFQEFVDFYLSRVSAPSNNCNEESDGILKKSFAFSSFQLPSLLDILDIRLSISSLEAMQHFMSLGGGVFLVTLWNMLQKGDQEKITKSKRTMSSGRCLSYITIINCMLDSVSQYFPSQASSQHIKNSEMKSNHSGNTASNPKALTPVEEEATASSAQSKPDAPAHLAGLMAARVKMQQKAEADDSSRTTSSTPLSAVEETTASSAQSKPDAPAHLAGLMAARVKMQQKAEADDSSRTTSSTPLSAVEETTASSAQSKPDAPAHLAGLMAARVKMQQKAEADDSSRTTSSTPLSAVEETTASSAQSKPDAPAHLAGLMAARVKMQQKAEADDSSRTTSSTPLSAVEETTASSAQSKPDAPAHLAGLMAARVKMQQKAEADDSSRTTSSTPLSAVEETTASSAQSKPDAPAHLAGLMAARVKMQQKAEADDCSRTTSSTPLSAVEETTASSAQSKPDAPAHLAGLMAARVKMQQKAEADDCSAVKETTTYLSRQSSNKKSSCVRRENSNAGLNESFCGTASSKAKVKDEVVHRMRGCFWEPLAAMDNHPCVFCPPETFLGDTPPPTLPSEVFDSIRQEFTQVISTKKLTEEERIGRAVGAIGGKLSKGSLTFMDQRRFNNIAIKLRQINKPNEYIRVAVLQLDEEFLTMDRVNALLQCAPTGDDMESIEPYDGDPDLLATCERFFYDIQHVPFFTRRIEAFKARLEIGSELDHLIEIIGNMCMATHSVFYSKSLSALVHIVLQIGNFMNEGTSRANAKGFDISFLQKLSYIKSGNLQSNLLKYIVAYVDKDYSCLIDNLLDDLSMCADAAKYSYKHIDAAVTLLKKKLNIIKTTTNAVKFKNKKSKADPDDCFVEKMSNFLASMDILMNVIVKSVVEDLKANVACVMQYFGWTKDDNDSDKEWKPEIFFSMLQDFCSQLHYTRKSIALEASAEKIKRLKKEAQEALQEEKKSKAIANEKLRTVSVSSDTTGARRMYPRAEHQNPTNIHRQSAQEAFTSLIAATRDAMSRRRDRASREDTGESDGATEISGVPSPALLLRNQSKASKQPKVPEYEDVRMGAFTIAADCVKIWNAIQSVSHESNWFAMTLHYETNTIALSGSGGGGLAELRTFMANELEKSTATRISKPKIQRSAQSVWRGPFVACLRVNAIDGSSQRSKIVVTYINPGSNLPMKYRGQLSECKTKIQSFFNGVHVELNSESYMADIAEKEITERLLAAGGAHSPHTFIM